MDILRKILKLIERLIFLTLVFAFALFVISIFMPDEVVHAFGLLRELFT